MKKIMALCLVVAGVSGCKTRQFNTTDGSSVEELDVLFNRPGTNTFKNNEKCIVLPEMPGGKYSKKDKETETTYCKVDFYAEGIGICPKTKSTSPGTYVYSYDPKLTNQKAFEAASCPDSDDAKKKFKSDKIATFKQTMNASGTSGTFSTASLLYYHFSRYFDSTVYVPVSVYREMDRKTHFSRVTQKGQAQTNKGMIAAGWDILGKAEQTPNSYTPTLELFTKDLTKIYGVFVRSKGERYGEEVNGVRGGWGVQDNLDFQKTPGFLALKNEGSFKSAVALQAKKNLPAQQVAFWAQELSEIILFDYIFQQQDRVGNVDYSWAWVYKDPNDPTQLKEDKVADNFSDSPRSSYEKIVASITPELKKNNAVLLQRTRLNDNDAGGRAYAGFAMKTKSLDGMRHFNGKTYAKVIALNKDLQEKGSLYQYIHNNFPLSDKAQIPQIVKNTQIVKQLLVDLCSKGKLKFDLDAEEYFKTGDVKPSPVKCDGSGL